MIVAVCANPALDITYRVPVVRHGHTHTVHEVARRAGGKGTNVARVLHGLGVPVTLVAPLGGHTGERFRLLLGELPLAATPIGDETRSSVAVVDDADATVLNERGPALTSTEWDAFAAAVAATLHAGDVLVLSGSLPGGAPDSGYADLVALAARSGARSIVDAHSRALELALAAGPDVVAPNLAEAQGLVGEHDVPTCAALLRGRGAGAAVVSAGPDGLHADTSDGRWSVAPPRTIAGNPTGAGDALTAALALGLHEGTPWPDVVREAVANAGAAVASPVAGELDHAVRAELLASTIVKEF